MTLKLLVNGSQSYKFVLIKDSVDEQSFLLFRAFAKEGMASGKEVHVLCFDHCPADVEKSLNLHRNGKLYFHDHFSDPSGWMKDQSYQENDPCKSLFSSIQKSSSDCSSLLIIIDSLSSCIISHGVRNVYRQIHQLINQSTGKGDCLKQLVSIIYPEVHVNYEPIIVQFSRLVTSWITTMPRRTSQEKLAIKIEHRKANGKMLKQIEECWIDSQCLLQSKKIEIAKDSVSRSNSEMPSQLTTFKLDLNEKEKAARSQLVLPYLKTDSSGGGTIYYEPDENDDWDDEDPDDDLDI